MHISVYKRKGKEELHGSEKVTCLCKRLFFDSLQVCHSVDSCHDFM